MQAQAVVAGGAAGLTVESAVAQWGHRRRLRLWVSWHGSWANHDISFGLRGDIAGMRRINPRGNQGVRLPSGGYPLEASSKGGGHLEATVKAEALRGPNGRPAAMETL